MLYKISPLDNVGVELETGHKKALCAIKNGENVIKYGFPIGHAIADIQPGEAVHTHNLKTNLSEKLDYTYQPKWQELSPLPQKTFLGYRRKDGQVGIRNDVWIINTVGCVNKIAEKIAALTGALAFPHPYGCSQLGGDHEITQKILCGLIRHPNAGGVLVLGLGCENNNIPELKKMLGIYDPDRVKFLNAQETDDEVATGIAEIKKLQAYAASFQRESIPASELKVGLKCGGSDGLSGITANPLVGRVSDILIASGGTSVLSEVPEMFGAETILMERCESKAVFDKTVQLINRFKDYFIRHNQVIYENPSPGNKAGGISTLEEKSLGCVQKGGTAKIVDVLSYGNRLTKRGLNLLDGPGNDMVAITNLTAAGVHIILFTTGRGTPLGAPVPTIKISTNSGLFLHKPQWIDFNAGILAEGEHIEKTSEELFEFCLNVASGLQTKNEQHGYREISIFKDGVTL